MAYMYEWIDLNHTSWAGRLRPERLTSRLVVDKLCLEAQVAHIFLSTQIGEGPKSLSVTLSRKGTMHS